MKTSCNVALLLVLAACNNNPAEGKTMAKVNEPAAVTQAASSATAANKYVFSNAASTFGFVGAKVTRKHDGAFHVFTGNIDLVESDPRKSVVTVEVATASLTADDPKLTEHLKSPDLLDVVKFPKASFRSTSIEPTSDRIATHSITGNLQFHGVTKSPSISLATRSKISEVSHVSSSCSSSAGSCCFCVCAGFDRLRMWRGSFLPLVAECSGSRRERYGAWWIIA